MQGSPTLKASLPARWASSSASRGERRSRHGISQTAPLVAQRRTARTAVFVECTRAGTLRTDSRELPSASRAARRPAGFLEDGPQPPGSARSSATSRSLSPTRAASQPRVQHDKAARSASMTTSGVRKRHRRYARGLHPFGNTEPVERIPLKAQVAAAAFDITIRSGAHTLPPAAAPRSVTHGDPPRFALRGPF